MPLPPASPPPKPIAIRAVLVGELQPLGARGAVSGIAKTPVDGPVQLARLGLAGDAHADLRVHGGPEKAVHHYPFDHYSAWRETLPPDADHKLLAAPGAFGENISTRGLTEADVCIGDRYRLGTALVEVSQARQPCWKLSERFRYPGMSRAVQQSMRTGWYYRVLEDGEASSGDTLERVARPHPEWTLARTLHVLYVDRLNLEALTAMAALAPLAESWRKLARQRLACLTVEDMEKRLGPAV